MMLIKLFKSSSPNVLRFSRNGRFRVSQKYSSMMKFADFALLVTKNGIDYFFLCCVRERRSTYDFFRIISCCRFLIDVPFRIKYKMSSADEIESNYIDSSLINFGFYEV